MIEGYLHSALWKRIVCFSSISWSSVNCGLYADRHLEYEREQFKVINPGKGNYERVNATH